MIALDVIVKYGVGEKANAGAWGDLCTFAQGVSADDVMPLLKDGEKEFKERTGEQLPAAYRSAKSVLKNALLYGVSVMGDNGVPLGKTAVEKAIKEARASSADKSKDVRDVFDACVEKMRKAVSAVSDETEKIVLKNYLDDILPSIWGY